MAVVRLFGSAGNPSRGGIDARPLLLVAWVVVALAACASDRGSEDTVPSSDPSPSASAVTTSPPTWTEPFPSSIAAVSDEPPVTTAAPPDEPSTTQRLSDPLRAASAAFQGWAGHLAEGDHQEAWEAMARTSQAAVGEDLFFSSLVFEMSEGWGSWSVAEDIDFRLEEDENGRILLWVSGTIRPEGMTEEREVAVPDGRIRR